jgi:hypothetical protein
LKQGDVLIALEKVEFMGRSYYCGYHERDATASAAMSHYDPKYFQEGHVVLRVSGEPDLRGQWDNGNSLNFIIGSKVETGIPLNNLYLRLMRLQEQYDCALSINNTFDFEIYAKVRGPRRFEFLLDFIKDGSCLFDEDFKPFWGKVVEPCVNYIDGFAQLSPGTYIWVQAYDDVNRFFGIGFYSKKLVSVHAKAIRREDGTDPIERPEISDIQPFPDTDTSKEIAKYQNTSLPIHETAVDVQLESLPNEFKDHALLQEARSRGSAIANRLKLHNIDHKLFREGGITIPMKGGRRTLADVVEKIVLDSAVLSFHVQDTWIDTRCQVTTSTEEPNSKFLAVYSIAMNGLDNEDLFLNFPEGIINIDASFPPVPSNAYSTSHTIVSGGTKILFTCDFCGRGFRGLQNMASHLQTHNPDMSERDCVVSHVGVLVRLTFHKVAFSLLATKRSFARWKYRTEISRQHHRDGPHSGIREQRENVHSLAKSGRENRLLRTKLQKEEDKKALLADALSMANTAVALDKIQIFESAEEKYQGACVLLQQVFIRGVTPEDKEKLGSIRATYVTRIQELKELTPASVPDAEMDMGRVANERREELLRRVRG